MKLTSRRLGPPVGAVLVLLLSASLSAVSASASTARSQVAPSQVAPSQVAQSPVGDAGMLMNYTVNSADGKATMAQVEDAVVAAGGVVLSQYKPIGVTVAQSSRSAFARDLRELDLIDSVGATRTSAVGAELPEKTGPESPLRDATIEPEPREDEQWGLETLQALAANEIEDGARSVLVGVLDSGSNDLHEDLRANFNRKASVDCESGNGVPNRADGAWRPTRSHGTHTAGTVAAARNGKGVAGVAPGIQFASIKVSNDDGFYFPEYVLCGFWWAIKHDVDITNNSYYVDPWYFWCADDPDQGAVQESLARMIEQTHRRGIINVAAAGNSNYDLAHKTTDSSSPNDSTPIDRPINAGCLDIPAEIDGVVTVSAIQESGTKASFSNYGKDIIDVAAPGVNILSTLWPGNDAYGYLSGTSMASPHVTGVVALIESAHPELSRRETLRRLERTAVETPCGGADGCQGPPEDNGFYGRGVVNALDAVS